MDSSRVAAPRWLLWWPVAGACLLLAIAVCSLLGWTFAWLPLLRLSAGTSAIACDTALLLFVSALGLLALQSGRPRPAAAIGGFVALTGLGGLLCAQVPGTFFSVHRFFPAWTRHVLQLPNASVMAMSVPVALVFVLLGSALLLSVLARRRPALLWNLALTGPALIGAGTLALLAMAGRLHVFLGQERFLIQMSPWTAVSSIIAGLSLAALFAARHPVARQNLPTTVAILSAVALFFLRSGMDYDIFLNSNAIEVVRSSIAGEQRQAEQMGAVLLATRAAEAHLLAFLLTADNAEAQSFAARQAEAQRLSAASPHGVDPGLYRAIGNKLELLAHTATLAQQGQHAAALSVISSLQNHRLTAQIQTLASLATAGLHRSAASTNQTNLATLAAARRAAVLSIGISTLLISAAVALVFSELRRWRREQDKLRHNEQILEDRVRERTAALVTESERRATADRQSRLAQARLHMSLAFAKMAAWTYIPSQADPIAWDGPVEAVFGVPATELNRYEDLAGQIHPDDRARVSDAVATTLQTGRPYSEEFRFLSGDGSLRWIAGVGGALFEDDSFVQMSGVNFDITPQKNAEQVLIERERALRERDGKLALVFETGAIGDWNWQLRTGIIQAHAAVWKLFGSDPQPAGQRYEWFRQRQHPADAPAILEQLESALRNCRPFDLEFRILRPDSAVHWVACRGTIVSDNQGTPTEVHGICLDISQRKEMELALRESEAQFRHLADAMPQIVWQARADGRIDFYNSRWYQLTGLPRTPNHSTDWSAAIHPADAPRFATLWQASVSSGLNFEMELRLPGTVINQNPYRWYLARALAIRDGDGRILRWFGTATDIHQQKIAEESLEAEVALRTEDLQRALHEKDVLFREVHHRVKNNLQVISSLLSMQGDLLEEGSARSALEEGRQRVLSMSLIHERLYSGNDLSRLEFGAYLRSLANELSSIYGKRGQVEIDIHEPGGVYLELDQAIPCGLILNELLTNALKYAYPDGSGLIELTLQPDKDGQLTMAVSDHGIGLPADFETRKEKSLGISIVEILIQQLSGKLHIQSHPGTRFEVQFTPTALSRLEPAAPVEREA